MIILSIILYVLGMVTTYLLLVSAKAMPENKFRAAFAVTAWIILIPAISIVAFVNNRG
jgi:hypothetical protein